MTHDNNRCGLRGRFIRTEKGTQAFKVESRITLTYYNRKVIQLPDEYILGEEIDIKEIARDHRGIVIRGSIETINGEIEERNGKFFFVADYIQYVVPIQNLLDSIDVIEIKPEIHDPNGAIRRLNGWRN